MKIFSILVTAVLVLGTATPPPNKDNPLPQHIIVMVVPGLGASQMAYARTQSDNTLFMDQFEVRATLLPYALAQGGITGALSMLLNGRTDTLDGSRGNLLLQAKELGYATAFLTTDQLFTGNGALTLGLDEKGLAGRSPVATVAGLRHDLLMGGGAWTLNGDDRMEVLLALQKEGYTHYSGLKGNARRMKGERLMVTEADQVLPPAMSGRKDFLSDAWDNVLYRMPMGSGGKSFTVMYLHHVHQACAANSPQYLVTEMEDIDALAGKVLQAVQSPGNTLVVLVSPYETGGMALLPGKKDAGATGVAWHSKDATATETLVYAKGVGADELQGAYAHHELWRRLHQLMGQ
ncbi:MAG: hypothetical protein HYZ16_03625 [Bacteroidetes bacterium]|nr:hypothetical protein [Bacteroidota bacterium]